MLTEVMRHYGLVRELKWAGYYATEHHKQTCREVRAAILAGRLFAVSGVIGSGKTALLRHLQADLARENKVLVSKSLAVDQERTTVATLIDALFLDLSPEGEAKVPKQVEKRERELRALIRRRRKPVALFVDEAYNLHPKTLTGLKRLIEVIADGGGRLSVLLAGHPKLRNDLRQPTMEEIGYRTSSFAERAVDDGRCPGRLYHELLIHEPEPVTVINPVMEGTRASGTVKVLLIENDRVVRMILAEMLSNAGLQIAELPDGERLFEPEPSFEPPRVIVTDIDLGETCHDGLDVAGQARRCWPDVGIVFITGQPSRLNQQRQGERDRFVLKPFRSAQLVEAVVSLLQT